MEKLFNLDFREYKKSINHKNLQRKILEAEKEVFNKKMSYIIDKIDAESEESSEEEDIEIKNYSQ